MPTKNIQCCCENVFNNLLHLETLVQLTKEVCQEKEFSSAYYNLKSPQNTNLSIERNHYINMLTLALEKINHIKETTSQLEEELMLYKSTPTIAAER